MSGQKRMKFVICVTAMLLVTGMAQADVLNMGAGPTSLETIQVGNPGNAADGNGYGAVSYEYDIGTYEVTNAQYVEFLNAVAATDTYGLYNVSMWSNGRGCKIERTGSSGSYAYSVAGDRADRPVNYVSWGDSARFSNWLTNGQLTGTQDLTTTEAGAYDLNGAMTDAELLAVTRNAVSHGYFIPTEDEWYKAAYHDKTAGLAATYFDYPTGTNSIPSNDLVDPDLGNNANFYQSGYTLGSPYYTTEAGEFENSDSPYGTFDQGGNLWEWNDAINGSYRGVRGGAFNGDDYYLLASYRLGSNPSVESNDLGFRVAEVPEPATAAILMLGGIGLLRRRRELGR